jgi:hypothetical protein
MYQRNYKSIHGARRSRIWGEYLEMGKTVGESETPVLGELNPSKNSKIPRRGLKITNGGLGVAFTVKLERRKVRNE